MRTNAVPSIEVTVKSFQDVVENIGKDFTRPDDDWLGMVVCQTKEGDHIIPALFHNDEEKWLFANVVVPTVILHARPYAVCQVLSAWMVEGGPEDDPLEYRPAEHPKRVEVVLIVVITVDLEQMWSAPIFRFPDKPPRLGPWRLSPRADSVVGDFFTPIREALLSLEES